MELNITVPPAEEISPEVAADLEKIYAIEADWQRRMDDPLLTIFDISGIKNCAEKFSVTQRMAYLRCKELGLFLYQKTAAK